ncbi:MAG: isoprenylcysteine carboxylmethyltransferase family protein [Candidatus Fermentibacteraceae bacterium]|nr:isoprenylcysteine carboxylmethyltransferase family protein [Candidatus Fermentibacteraceae bacterium]
MKSKWIIRRKTPFDPLIIRTMLAASAFSCIVVLLLPEGIHLATRDMVTVDIGALRYLGLVPLALGACIALWCVMEFVVRGRGTPAPFDPPVQLVCQGPYRYVRNPMYIGMLLVLAGEAVLMSSLFVLFYALLLWIASHLFVVFWEEPRLRRRFGENYADYLKTVRRWLPRRQEKTDTMQVAHG